MKMLLKEEVRGYAFYIVMETTLLIMENHGKIMFLNSVGTLKGVILATSILLIFQTDRSKSSGP